MIPIIGFLQGDTIGLLILAHENWSMEDLARKLQQMARIRVAPLDRPTVIYCGRSIPSERSVSEVGIKALERIDVRNEGEL